MAGRERDFGGVPAPPIMPYELGAGSGLLSSPFSIGVDPAILGEEPEFIFPTDSSGQRSWSEKLLWSTGACYMTGLTVGSIWGLTEGLTIPNRTGRLRWNSVLNGITRRGPFLANNIAIVALMYRMMEYSVIKIRKVDDPANKVGCAIATGILYKCTAGHKPMLVGGILGAAFSVSSILLAKAVSEHWLPWM